MHATIHCCTKGCMIARRHNDIILLLKRYQQRNLLIYICWMQLWFCAGVVFFYDITIK